MTFIGNRISAVGSKLLWGQIRISMEPKSNDWVLLRRNFGHRDSETLRGEGHAKTKEDLSNMPGWLSWREITKSVCVTLVK